MVQLHVLSALYYESGLPKRLKSRAEKSGFAD